MSRTRHASEAALQARSGMALIIVLGMLAIMVLMGVAFSISMRTERLAANAYADIIRARNLMDAALGRVVTEHIPDALATYNEFYPSWSTDPFQGGGAGQNFMANKGLLYVPGVLRDAAERGDFLEWIDIRDTLTGRFHGQYAYMVVNNSGLIDANVVMKTDRRYGADSDELQVLAEIFDEATYDPNRQEGGPLGTWRDRWFIRFETLPELHALGVWNAHNVTASIVNQPPPFRPGSYVDHFHVFSHYPDGEYVAPSGPPETHPKVFIGGEPEDWDDAAIIQALMRPPDAPFESSEDARDFLNLMKDYASESYVPANIDGMSFKRVPMINEVIMSNTFERLPPDGITYTNDLLYLRVHITVETWFPFPEPPAMPSFSVRIDSPPELTTLAGFEDLDDLELIDEEVPPPHSGGPHDYRLWHFTYESYAEVDWDIVRDLRVFPLRAEIKGNIDVVLTETDQPVNRVVGPWEERAFEFIIRGLGDLPYQDEVPMGPAVAYSVNDPRLNWDPSDARSPSGHWRPVTRTPGSRNEDLDGPFDEVDVSPPMYCAQRAFESVGELSYLLFSGDVREPFQPWRTARLLGPDPDYSARIIDRFTVSGQPYRRGLVNINTAYVPVLQAALYQAPIEPWRQRVGITRRATAQEAYDIAESIVNDIANTDGARNLSDLATLPGVTTDTVGMRLGITPPNKFGSESIIRNSLGMLGTRDTLYTVFLMTRTFPRGYDPEPPQSEIQVPPGVDPDDLVVAEQRAVALVWRDPALKDGANRSIVRSFIWLTEED